jgi:hypothetical protein
MDKSKYICVNLIFSEKVAYRLADNLILAKETIKIPIHEIIGMCQ